jgi:fucose permease
MAVRLGKKHAAILLSFLGVIGFTGIAYFNTPYGLIFLYLLTGLGRGSASTVTNEVVNEASEGDAKAMNVLHTFFAVGAFLAPFIAFACVVSGLGWKVAVLIVAVLLMVRILVFWQMPIMDHQPQVEASDPLNSNDKLATLSYLRNPSYYLIGGLMFFYLGAENAVNGWAVAYLKDTGIMSTTLAQSVLSILWVVIIFGRLFSGYLSKHVGKSSLLVGNSIGSVIFFILFMMTRNTTWIVALIVGLGFFFAGVFPTALAAIGPELKGSKLGMGLLLAWSGMGAIIMPYITGVVADKVGITGGMATISGAMLLMLLFSILMHLRTRNLKRQAAEVSRNETPA